MNDKMNIFLRDGLKLNLGCEQDTKEDFVNIDYEKKQGVCLDIVANLACGIPIKDNIALFVYSSHMIEHLHWNDAVLFLRECHRCLKFGGQLRLLFPNFKKIMEAYINNDHDFFIDIFDYLNKDYLYYQSMVDDPKKAIKGRENNMPPFWHYSDSINDRKKVVLRARKYNHLIECVDWFVHQYGEHIALYDDVSIEQLLKNVGFSEVKQSDYDSTIDASNPIRIKTTSYITAIKQ